MSPLKRIPVLIDGQYILNDSTVICEYLEDKYPAQKSNFGVHHNVPIARANSRYLEEFCDTKLADVLIWKLFAAAVIKPTTLKTVRSKHEIEQIIAVDIPIVLDALEVILRSFDKNRELMTFDEKHMTVGDITLGCLFRNAQLVRYSLTDLVRWPLSCARVNAILSSKEFMLLRPVEDTIIRNTPEKHHDVLESLGWDIDRTMQLMNYTAQDVPQLSPFSQLR